MVRPAPRIQSAPMRRRPVSPLVPLVVVVLLVIVGLFVFSTMAREQPTKTIEIDVANGTVAK